MVIQADTIETLKQLISDGVKINHIITDAPYKIGIAAWDKLPPIKELTALFYELLPDNGSIFFFTGWSSYVEVVSNWDKRFTLKDSIIYDRIKGRGTKKSLVSTREDILWYIKKDWTFHKDLAYSTIVKKTKGMGRKNGRDTRALSNVWTDVSPIVPWAKQYVKYPAQKPIALMNRIIEVFTNPGDVILDCYCGSGTTLLSAKNLGREFIGIDNNPEAIELTNLRLERGW